MDNKEKVKKILEKYFTKEYISPRLLEIADESIANADFEYLQKVLRIVGKDFVNKSIPTNEEEIAEVIVRTPSILTEYVNRQGYLDHIITDHIVAGNEVIVADAIEEIILQLQDLV